MDNIAVRRFTPGEEQQICNLINGIMGQEFGADAVAYPTQDIEKLSENYGKPGEAFFVAVDGNQIVGTVGVKKEDERVALMRRLFVSSVYRKKKIGIQLVERALQFAKEVGYSEVVFKTTSKMVKANELCQKCGFIQRAKIVLGPIELFKFSLSLRNGSKSTAA